MQSRSHAGWIILLSFFVAYLLAVVPFPRWAMLFRPEWVAIVLIYWAMALPYRIGIGFAWVIGMLMDSLSGSLLGLHALTYAIIVYMTLNLHQRLRMFSSVQQSGLVLALVGLSLMINHWIQIATGDTTASSLLFLLGALSSAFMWPWVFIILRNLRRSFDVR